MTERQRVDALIDVFQKTRFYSGNRKKNPSSRNPSSLYAAWNEFLRNYKFGASQHFEKSLKREELYIQRHEYSRAITIHKACHKLNVTCAVPMGVYCPLCLTETVRLSKTSLAFGQLPPTIQALAKSLDQERLISENQRKAAIANLYWQVKDDDEAIPTQTPYGDEEGDVPMEEETGFDVSHTPEPYPEHPRTTDLSVPKNPNYLGSQAIGHERSGKKTYRVDRSDQRSSQRYTSAAQQSRPKEEGHGKRPYSQTNCDGFYSLRSKVEGLQELVEKHEKTISILVRKLDRFQQQMDERDSYRHSHDEYEDLGRKRSRSNTSSSGLHKM
jgi:hypothetical protein